MEIEQLIILVGLPIAIQLIRKYGLDKKISPEAKKILIPIISVLAGAGANAGVAAGGGAPVDWVTLLQGAGIGVGSVGVHSTLKNVKQGVTKKK